MSSRVMVVSGGLRSPSTTRQLADELGRALAARGDVELEFVDVRDHAHAIVDALLTGFATGELADVLERLVAADALVAVTPTFQAGVGGLFKSFWDLVEAGSLRGIPVLLAATGGSERHSLVVEHGLRPMFAYLGALTVPTGVFAATQDFGGAGSHALTERVERGAGELRELLGGASIRRPVIDEFDDVSAFTQLLRRQEPSA